MPSLQDRMQALAKATGQVVVIGCYSHRDDWFARCDEVEWQGSTPGQALDAVRDTLVRNAETQVAALAAATDKVQRLREL